MIDGIDIIYQIIITAFMIMFMVISFGLGGFILAKNKELRLKLARKNFIFVDMQHLGDTKWLIIEEKEIDARDHGFNWGPTRKQQGRYFLRDIDEGVPELDDKGNIVKDKDGRTKYKEEPKLTKGTRRGRPWYFFTSDNPMPHSIVPHSLEPRFHPQTMHEINKGNITTAIAKAKVRKDVLPTLNIIMIFFLIIMVGVAIFLLMGMHPATTATTSPPTTTNPTTTVPG